MLQSTALAGVKLFTSTVQEMGPPRLWPELALITCDDGGGEVRWGRSVQTLDAGAVLLRGPYQLSPMLRRAAAATRLRLVLIDAELLRALPVPGTLGRSHFGSLVTRAPAVVAGAAALWRSVAHDEDAAAQQRRLDALLEAVRPIVATEALGPSPLSRGVARTLEVLHARFAEELPLDELSRRAGVAKCHLVHAFHDQIGLPPHAYQIQLRVARACVLAAAGVALAEVATLSGFSDQSHLTRQFKRIVGITPGRYAALAATVRPAQRYSATGDGGASAQGSASSSVK